MASKRLNTRTSYFVYENNSQSNFQIFRKQVCLSMPRSGGNHTVHLRYGHRDLIWTARWKNFDPQPCVHSPYFRLAVEIIFHQGHYCHLITSDEILQVTPKATSRAPFLSSRLLLGAFPGNITASNFQTSWPGIGRKKHERASRTENAVCVGRSHVHICPVWKPNGWSFLLLKVGTDAPDNSLGLKTEWEWTNCNAENWTEAWFNKRQDVEDNSRAQCRWLPSTDLRGFQCTEGVSTDVRMTLNIWKP